MSKMNQTESKALDSLICGSDCADGSFAKAVVQISQLLVERWLQTERGKQFHQDVDDTSVPYEERVRKALSKQGIHIANWITPELNLDSFECSLECDSSKPDYALIWKLPYQFRTKEEVSDEKLRSWIEICQEWLDNEKWKDPEPDFPDTPSMYIPLATT